MQAASQPADEYPLLYAAVAGKRVIVVADKARDWPQWNPATEVLVRFNNDPHPADIWVCSFSGQASATLARTAKLIIGSIPCAQIALPAFDVEADFAAECYATFEAGPAPREIVQLPRWYALCREMPIWPTSGAVFMDLLLATDFRDCQVFGMDFFRDRLNAVPLKEGRWMASRHDIHEYIAWFERRVLPDPRVTVEGVERIAATKEAWARWMIAELYVRRGS